jgi:prepilin-type N-terminal cleavage/methylation domain-containing protein
MYHSKAFSLIELMVVIAIVAILTAVAVPSYKAYATKAKFSAARQFLDGFSNQVLKFYTANGAFPTSFAAIDLTDPGTPTSVSGYIFPPYLGVITIDGPTLTTGQCPYAIIGAQMSNYDNGDYFTNPNASAIFYTNTIIDVNGTLITKCRYGVSINGNLVLDTNAFFPDCFDLLSGGTDPADALINSCP